jgi:hypothetical protein
MPLPKMARGHRVCGLWLRFYQLPIGMDTWEISHTASRRLLIVFST